MVDSNHIFVRGTCGFSGNFHDAVVFSINQALLTYIKQVKFIPQISRDVNGVQVLLSLCVKCKEDRMRKIKAKVKETSHVTSMSTAHPVQM